MWAKYVISLGFLAIFAFHSRFGRQNLARLGIDKIRAAPAVATFFGWHGRCICPRHLTAAYRGAIALVGQEDIVRNHQNLPLALATWAIASFGGLAFLVALELSR